MNRTQEGKGAQQAGLSQFKLNWTQLNRLRNGNERDGYRDFGMRMKCKEWVG